MAAPEEKFNAQKHRAHGIEHPPADAVIAGTLAPGFTFQGRPIRPALVQLRDTNAPVAEVSAAPAEETAPEKSEEESAAAGQLTLEAN